MQYTQQSRPIPNRRRGLQPTPPPHRPMSIRKVLMFLAPLIALVLFISVCIPRISTALEEREKQQQQAEFSTALSNAINPVLAAQSGPTIGVALTDLESGITRTYGTTSAFAAASTSKIITALAYYHAVEQGRLDLTHSLGSFNAEFQIKQMINQSNNQSWEMLVEDLGRTSLQQYAKSIDTDYTVGSNTISPASMSRLLAKLYQGKLLNTIHTAQLLSYMQATNDETMIPSGVDDGVTTYHKYGLLEGNLHDVGIVSKNGSTFSMAIYTKNVSDHDDAARTRVIATLAGTASRVAFGENNPYYLTAKAK